MHRPRSVTARRWPAGLLALAGLLPLAATAQSVALSGILGSKALLVIDGGAPRALAAQEALHGVRVLEIRADSAVVEIQGRRQTLGLGQSPVSLGQAQRNQRLVLQPDSRGHFKGSGFINRQPMQYMVDTGASSVAIGRPDAERLGLPFLQGQPVMLSTANGNAKGWRVRLSSVRIGDIEAFGIDAVVTSEPMPYVLLGNSFLSHVQMTRQSHEMVLQQR